MVIAPPLPLSDRPEFGPPPNARSWRALALAVAAHLLLVVALTWGVNWKNSDEAAAFSAELWTGQAPPQSSTPLAQPTQPAPQPAPTPPQPAQPPPAPAPPKVEAPPPDVDIAMEQAKKRALLRKQQAAEDREEQKSADLAAKKQAKLKEDQARFQEEKVRLKAEQAADKAQAVKLKAQEAAKEAAKEAAREAAEDAKEAKDAKEARNAKDAQRKQEQQKQAATAAAAAKGQRDANLARLNAQLGSAGATGGSPKGTAAQGSGGSTTYGAIVKAAIKPNVVFGEDITGNPMAKVEVRLTLDGTIISQRLIASSGNKAWDDAAMNGITRTRVMPRDVDGRIPDTTLILEMRPKN